MELKQHSFNGVRIIFEPFGKNMCQVFTIIRQQSYSLFDTETIILDDDQNKQLQ